MDTTNLVKFNGLTEVIISDPADSLLVRIREAVSTGKISVTVRARPRQAWKIATHQFWQYVHDK